VEYTDQWEIKIRKGSPDGPDTASVTEVMPGAPGVRQGHDNGMDGQDQKKQGSA
jgi:hypothetical protein